MDVRELVHTKERTARAAHHHSSTTQHHGKRHHIECAHAIGDAGGTFVDLRTRAPDPRNFPNIKDTEHLARVQRREIGAFTAQYQSVTVCDVAPSQGGARADWQSHARGGRLACASGGVTDSFVGFTNEETQNSVEPRQSHSSFMSYKAHVDKTARSMWTRLVSTRPVSDQQQKFSVDVSFARKQSGIRAQCVQPHTHGGSPWVVACQR